ncbi:hypothetical protein ACFLEY_22395 [Bradyrhizobium sp. YCK136]|uniref:hypothetical protein n=1 Tax=Bradyrhizobium sp. YCK136 TaxID=3351346 RepID=UPI0037C7B583
MEKVMVSPRVAEVVKGFSIDEVRQLLELREEVLAIARGPERAAIEWLKRRRARGRSRCLRTDPGRD